MTDDEWTEIEDHLVQEFGVGSFEAFAQTAGDILKRELLERGLGSVDPASLDPDLAGQLLISAWTDAALKCFPERDPAWAVEHLAMVVDQASSNDDADPRASSQRH